MRTREYRKEERRAPNHTASDESMAAQAVLESEDVLSIVHKYIEPEAAVAVARVSRDVRSAQRAVLRADPTLLGRIANNAGGLTKGRLMGWFGLSSKEADALPRAQYVRRGGGGFYYLYKEPAFEQAQQMFKMPAGVAAWEARLHARRSETPRFPPMRGLATLKRQRAPRPRSTAST